METSDNILMAAQSLSFWPLTTGTFYYSAKNIVLTTQISVNIMPKKNVKISDFNLITEKNKSTFSIISAVSDR